MRKSIVFSCLMMITAGTSFAAPVTLSLNNVAPEAVTAVTAVPKGETVEAPVNLLTAQLDVGQVGSLTVDAAEGVCIFELTFTFASGKTVVRPDLDLCQTEEILVE